MLSNLKTALQQRYCTKVFEPGAKVENDKIQTLLDTLVLTPTSINSQAWHLFAISASSEKARLAEAAWPNNQPKYKDGDYLFIFCAKTGFESKDLQEIEELTAKLHHKEVNVERLNMLSNYVDGMPEDEKSEWLKRQLYIVFGQFLTSCALLEIDACPIEGFDTATMDELLGLKEKGFTSVVSAVIGKRSVDDFNDITKAPKVRFAREQMITEIK